MKRQHWADLGESTFVAGIWFLYGVYRVLGRWPFRLLLYPVVSYYWLSRPLARRSSMQYLRRLHAAHPVFGAAPGHWQGYRHFLRFAETLLDKLLAIGGNYPSDRVDLSQHRVIWDELPPGQGFVVVTAHMGCLELMQAASGWKRKVKINILVHTAHATRFNRILERVNPDAGLNFLQVTAFNAPTAMMLADRIAAGEILAIAGDRIPVNGERAVQAAFLGHPAPFPAGPHLIASLLSCPAYAMACLRTPNGYRLQVEKLADAVSTPRRLREALIDRQVDRYARWLECRVIESPFDWFNFFPFWDQTLRHEG